MSMSYSDWFEFGMVSDCCSAGVYLNGICSACKDHCTPVEVEEEDNIVWEDGDKKFPNREIDRFGIEEDNYE